MINALIHDVETKHLRAEPLTFDVGDTVDVHCRILEGNKERVQVFSGVVIARNMEGATQRANGQPKSEAVGSAAKPEGESNAGAAQHPREGEAAAPEPAADSKLASRIALLLAKGQTLLSLDKADEGTVYQARAPTSRARFVIARASANPSALVAPLRHRFTRSKIPFSSS